ncbi:MAG: 3-hydroxyacyl-CoA dehydrogenase family protein [Peptococcaceae bacterium]|nr:3-hydroxyacyl-CoA dehydrogenase family protein [Peptococcaceae bacterium]MDH7525506.1 3-hydroxyacyl-CoA dehydrogenase family protein [Peptococcaceae bacterium]
MSMRASDIKKIACVGAGLIGAGWATNFLMKGYPVVLYDIKEEFLEQARQRISQNLQFLVNKKVLDEKRFAAAMQAVACTTSLEEAVKDVQLIQESGPENYEVKQALLVEIEKHAHPTAIFASSTSGLLISEIARYAQHPERCLGVHPYNPPHLIPLVEISKGDRTSDAVVDTVYEFLSSLGKEPVILRKEAPGFIANRLQMALYREAVDLVNRGVCSIEDVDKAACFGPGLRFGIMGPNLIYQLGGGAHGIKGLLTHVGPSVEMWWADMADWKKWPEGWPDKAQEGVNRAMANRPPEFGRTPEEIAAWRDDMLIELLKLHKKI